MFTYKSIKWIIAFTLLTIAVFGNYGQPRAALASGPDKVVTDANTYISYLDNLRSLGQTEANLAQARHEAEMAVFDYTSDLDALRNEAAAMQLSESHQGVSGDANSYISHLDQLRAMANSSPMDANSYITHLEGLRHKALHTSGVNSSHLVSQ